MTYTSEPTRHTNGAGKTATTEVKETLNTLRNDAKQLAGSLKNAAKETIEQQRDKVVSVGADVADRAQTIFSSLEEQVRTRPAAALGVTLGAGFLLGLMLAGRR
jgi:ElaB/YqjD/DUF883 family membrane-anchored ribosome-binding protein